MTLIAGELAFLWASIISLPIALAITVVLAWAWRVSPIQRIVMPGADECRRLESHLGWRLDHGEDLKPAEMAQVAQLGQGILIRNGLNALANALIFAVVFTGSHALLMAL